MQDTSGLEHEQLAVALSGVNLSLGRGAARVNTPKDLNLPVRRAEALALTGPSGSAKSPLLMVAAGLERAAPGSVVVAGKALSPLARMRWHASVGAISVLFSSRFISFTQ